MNTKLTRIKYFKWDGDPVKAKLALDNEAGITTDYANGNLILKMANGKFIPVYKGYYVVAVPSPVTMGQIYYRVGPDQFRQFMGILDRGGQLVLGH